MTANATSVRLCHPATASTSATAASTRTNEARASQRRVLTFIRFHPAKDWVAQASAWTGPAAGLAVILACMLR